jgi:F0F1-type ATP synthase assembly protein I
MSTSGPGGGPTPPSSSKPSSPAPSSEKGAVFNALVRAESLIQLALLLPAATFVGWAIGFGLDTWLHQHWIYLAGLILGAVAGFVQVFRIVAQLNKE